MCAKGRMNNGSRNCRSIFSTSGINRSLDMNPLFSSLRAWCVNGTFIYKICGNQWLLQLLLKSSCTWTFPPRVTLSYSPRSTADRPHKASSEAKRIQLSIMSSFIGASMLEKSTKHYTSLQWCMYGNLYEAGICTRGYPRNGMVVIHARVHGHMNPEDWRKRVGYFNGRWGRKDTTLVIMPPVE